MSKLELIFFPRGFSLTVSLTHPPAPRDPEREPPAPTAAAPVERRKRRKLPMIERPRSAPIYAGNSRIFMFLSYCHPKVNMKHRSSPSEHETPLLSLRTSNTAPLPQNIKHLSFPSGQVDFRKLSGCLSNVHDVCDFSHQDGSMKTVIRLIGI